MRYQDKNRPKLRGIFPTGFKAIDKESLKNTSPAIFSDVDQCYAINTENQTVKRFELVQSSGKRFSFSYSILPIYILPDSSTLFIKAYELLVTILGRNLNPLHEHFGNENIVWVKAVPSGKDDGQINTFVKEIIVQGQAVDEEI